MTASLIELLMRGDALLWQGLVVFLRVGSMMSLMPAFGEQSVPVRVRLVLGICFTMIVAPAVPAVEPSEGVFMRLLLTETLVGAMLGIGLRMFILAISTAGSMAAQATSLAQIFGGAATEPMPAIGHILVVSALALAVLSGLHIRLSELLILSYTPFPAGTLLTSADFSQWGVAQVARAFSLAFTLAAPFIIISVLYNLTLGVINRAMPQLMVAFVGAPVITAGGLILLFLLAPLMLTIWHDTFVGFIDNPLGALK
ncbi:MAG: flagellar biosynthesis protein FliR [Rhodobacterales bacterium]|nr:MAG: flagellar biosynthesis protein FliR [Rhodobacterales bacterium]